LDLLLYLVAVMHSLFHFSILNLHRILSHILLHFGSRIIFVFPHVIMLPRVLSSMMVLYILSLQLLTHLLQMFVPIQSFPLHQSLFLYLLAIVGVVGLGLIHNVFLRFSLYGTLLCNPVY
jgi:hypothetical protein